MMINEYCENILIQQTMADFLREKLGWQVSYAHNKEKLGANGTYGRESYEEVILLEGKGNDLCGNKISNRGYNFGSRAGCNL